MPDFSPAFRAELAELMRWRRDVRAFRADAVPQDLLADCLRSVTLAPSVGLSEPWRIVRLDGAAARAAALANFRAANAAALSDYEGAEAARYARLKLTGMETAPVQLAVWSDETTPKGRGLGARTMPEMRSYSAVAAITHLWLTARAHGLGMGWVSILDPDRLARDLGVDPGWRLVAYLCLGWPAAEDDTPALERAGWERRAPLSLEAR